MNDPIHEKLTAKTQVVVIGAGPAGCTAATLLAKKGYEVILLEKAKFPRYHVGESLMPHCWFTLEKLGVLEEMKRYQFVDKLSVQFVSQDGKQSRPFYFFLHRDHPSSYTWQVERAEFDQMLFENALKNGVKAYTETEVIGMLQNKEGQVIGVNIKNNRGEAAVIHAQITLDCTGRDALSQRKLQWRKRDPKLNKIAIWTYYRNAKRDEGIDAGSTTVAMIPNQGWFWYIPLKNNIVSVGVVNERDYLFRESRSNVEIMDREIQTNLWLKEHLEGAECLGEYWVTGEYSYRSEYCARDGLVLAGDAFAFLDPVFSSGVFLALKSGEMVADAISEALIKGDVSGKVFESYGEKLCGHIETMRKIVSAFYSEGFSFGKLIQLHPDLKGLLTDCLIGDTNKDFSELFAGMKELVELPQALEYGMKVKK
jgi:flavin-dependent dehydrogenase